MFDETGKIRASVRFADLARHVYFTETGEPLPEVKFWVRNLARKATSFRLQTSKDWFYPDFLCQLNDGHSLVVEYKGEHLFADAEDKRAVGAIWEGRSGGKCLFVMPEGMDLGKITRKLSGR